MLTALEPPMQVEGVFWAPDDKHFAVLSMDAGNVFNVYMFDSAGNWVGEAPGWGAAWAGDSTLIVLPYDPASADRSLAAYVASIGYNDIGTMVSLPGRYSGLLGNEQGGVVLENAQGYATWLSGSLLPEMECGCSPLSVSSDGSLMAVEDSAGLQVVRTGNGQVVQSWPDLRAGQHANATFSPDGLHLALSGVNGSLNTLAVLDITDGQRTDLLAGHLTYGGTWVDNAKLLAGDDAGTWWFLSLDGSTNKLTDLPTWSSDALTSSTGSIAAVDPAGHHLLIDRSGKTTSLALPAQALYLHWSHDGSQIVAGCELSVVLLVRP